jgi:putative HTH-type transcriptional regulator
VNENVDVTKCKGSGNCRNDSRCLTHTLWERLEDQIGQFLNTVSLDDLVQENADHDCDKSHCHEHLHEH